MSIVWLQTQVTHSGAVKYHEYWSLGNTSNHPSGDTCGTRGCAF
jgi:hypothetical protein